MTTFGLALPHYDGFFPDTSIAGARRTRAAISYAQRAEAIGFDEIWVSDHLGLNIDDGPARRSSDCWTLLAAIAAETRSIRLGSLVSNASLRPPALLAHQVATVLDLAGPRIDVGIGAGWNRDEYATAGLAFPSGPERLALVKGTAAELRRATGTAIPPLWIGGKRSGILTVAAEIADGWNFAWDPTPDQFRSRYARLGDLAGQTGRAVPQASVGLTTVVGRDERDLQRRWERLRRWVPGGHLDSVQFDEWRTRGLVGSVEEVSDRVHRWGQQGVDHIICAFGMPFGLFDDEQLDLAQKALGLAARPGAVGPSAPS